MASETPGKAPGATRHDRTSRRASRHGSSGRHGVERVLERNIAVHLITRRLVGAALLSVICAGISILCAIGILTHHAPPQYLPISSDGVLVQQPPLNRPNMDKGAAGAFALKVLHALYTYDYINWRDQLNAASLYFTPDGWNGYQKEVAASHTIDAVKRRKMIVSMEPTGEITVKQGAVGGVWLWVVSLPIKITYTANDITPSGALDAGNVQAGTVSVFMRRVPISINPDGVAVQMIRLKLDQAGS